MRTLPNKTIKYRFVRGDDTKLVRIARKLSKLEPKVQLRNFPSVEQIQDGSFEIFPSKLKKFENSQTSVGTFLNLSDNPYKLSESFAKSIFLI